MKYGLIYYKNTSNIGDDILSYAGKRFLPHVDYYIDREEMDLFLPNEDELVGAILNGWYLHHGYRFPPSPYIIPLFVGTHFGGSQMHAGGFSFLNGAVLDYLKEYGPVGCRDRQTMELLAEKGIDNYFSGCLTLTLEPFLDVANSETVILTDVPASVKSYVEKLLPNKKIVCKTHTIPYEEIGISWEKREQRVESYLKDYQSAKLVITTRLHCMLPSVALGTPVILIGNYDEDYYARLSDFTKYGSCFKEQEVLEGKADHALLHPMMKNQDLLEMKNGMVRACENFIDRLTSQYHKKKPLVRSVYKDIYIDRTVNMRQTIQSLLEHCIEMEDEQRKMLEKLTRLAEISQGLLQENERLKGILSVK